MSKPLALLFLDLSRLLCSSETGVFVHHYSQDKAQGLLCGLIFEVLLSHRAHRNTACYLFGIPGC